ncbi:MAG TPA: sigma 54-interacting transcriptional regulator [Cyclobacteriaceae bacterium]
MAITEHEIQSTKQRFGIIGNSPMLNNAIRVAIQVAPTEMTVLITGESGSGKESFSKIIHALSPRKHGQFTAINCGSIPEGTIDSELFGHEKGSFTGAHETRKGYFEATNNGTLFMDEIGEMPMSTQARLLRVLEYGEFIKVGASKPLKTDVRVVAATNVDLLRKVEEKKFREDLYYRLNTVPITVPPLRDRGDDIELLFRKFATDVGEKYKDKPQHLTEDARAELLKYRFPGNIRQLKNMVDQLYVMFPDTKEINAERLRTVIPQAPSLPALYLDGGSKENISEREILYKVLFELRKDVNDLKKAVGDGHLAAAQYSSQPVVPSVVNDSDNVLHFNHDNHVEEVETHDDVQDVSHVAEDDSLSIEKKEKELIMRALQKNNNKRKYAARDLGISERTLYRKIKQYELEE